MIFYLISVKSYGDLVYIYRSFLQQLTLLSQLDNTRGEHVNIHNPKVLLRSGHNLCAMPNVQTDQTVTSPSKTLSKYEPTFELCTSQSDHRHEHFVCFCFCSPQLLEHFQLWLLKPVDHPLYVCFFQPLPVYCSPLFWTFAEDC